jgi:hypothetical protein
MVTATIASVRGNREQADHVMREVLGRGREISGRVTPMAGRKNNAANVECLGIGQRIVDPPHSIANSTSNPRRRKVPTPIEEVRKRPVDELRS